MRERARHRDETQRANGRRLEPQRTARTEDERLDGRHRNRERVGDLRVGPPLELAEHERSALVERQPAEGPQYLFDIRPLVRGKGELIDVSLERDLLDAPARGCVARARHVVRDLDQPVVRLERFLAACERAVGVHERRLRDVLRVGGITKERERVVVDVLDVASVQRLERPIPS